MFNPTRRLRPVIIMLLVAAAAGLAFAAEDPPADDKPASVDPRWLERLDRLDRILLDQLIGYAPPAFTSDLKWFGSEPLTWEQLRGKVVLLQSWSHRTATGRRAAETAGRLAAEFKDQDLRLILLQTPDGAETLERYLQRRPADHPVVLDPTGTFCDALGVYKDPANILIGRNGAVRYAGLNREGTTKTIEKLLAETADPRAKPPQRTEQKTEQPEKIDYPPFDGTITGALDVRGKQAPKLFVEKWISPPPDPTGKVVVIDFWNTSCEACLDLRPRLNDLADQFRNQVIFIGLSDEWSSQFDEGLIEENLDEDDFHYTLALDPRRRMQDALNLRTLPHALVLSSDWIVRWQGPTQRLTAKTIEEIVRADASRDEGKQTRTRPKRWSGDR